MQKECPCANAHYEGLKSVFPLLAITLQRLDLQLTANSYFQERAL